MKKKIKEMFNTEKSYNWMWEFSKKVVVGIFIIYILNYLLCWSLSFLSGFYGWQISFLDVFITSTNETTQVILGGYLIKSMAENVIKIRSNDINKTSTNNKTMDSVDEEELLSDESDNDSSFDL